jgi:hypothetical protein
MSPRARSPGPHIAAMTLATEAAEALSVDEDERRELIGTALCVGQWLAEIGRPGEWEAVEVAAVLEAMAFTDSFACSTFLFALTTLFGYAALQEQVRLPAARRVLREIRRLTDNRAVAQFAVRTVEALSAGAGVSDSPGGPSEPHPSAARGSPPRS